MDTLVENGLKLCEALLRIMGKSAKAKVLGKEVKIGDLKDTLTEVAKRRAKMVAAHAAYLDAAAAQRGLLESTDVARVLSVLAAQLRTSLTKAELDACGITAPKKRRLLSAEERAASNAKLRATRAAHGIVGPRQRSAREAKEVLAAAYGSEPASPPETAPPDQGVARANGANGAH